jgi:hypothetical protein
MAKTDPQRYATTTRAGDKVEVRHGKNGLGETVSIQADGRGYETLHVDPPRQRHS